jgi:hypothetical protein
MGRGTARVFELRALRAEVHSLRASDAIMVVVRLNPIIGVWRPTTAAYDVELAVL